MADSPLTLVPPTAMSGLERGDGHMADAFAIRDEYGVVPRSVEKLFAQMEREQAVSKGTVSFGIYCSFIEVLILSTASTTDFHVLLLSTLSEAHGPISIFWGDHPDLQ